MGSEKLHLKLLLIVVALSAPGITFAVEPAPPADPSKKEEGSFWTGVKDTGSKILETSKDAASAVGKKLDETKDLRAKSRWAILGNYSLIDTWIPSKYGVTVAYIPSADAAWEIEYLRGSLSFELFIKDLGKMTDERLSLIRRFYSDRNSFSFFAGAAYHSFSVHLGDRLTSLISNNLIPNVDLVTVKTLGFIGGLGNRWQFGSGWTLGVDWFSMYVPIKTLEAEAPYVSSTASESGKNDVRDVMDVIKRIPTFAVFKFQVGMSF